MVFGGGLYTPELQDQLAVGVKFILSCVRIVFWLSRHVRHHCDSLNPWREKHGVPSSCVNFHLMKGMQVAKRKICDREDGVVAVL